MLPVNKIKIKYLNYRKVLGVSRKKKIIFSLRIGYPELGDVS